MAHPINDNAKNAVSDRPKDAIQEFDVNFTCAGHHLMRRHNTQPYCSLVPRRAVEHHGEKAEHSGGEAKRAKKKSGVQAQAKRGDDHSKCHAGNQPNVPRFVRARIPPGGKWHDTKKQ